MGKKKNYSNLSTPTQRSMDETLCLKLEVESGKEIFSAAIVVSFGTIYVAQYEPLNFFKQYIRYKEENLIY